MVSLFAGYFADGLIGILHFLHPTTLWLHCLLLPSCSLAFSSQYRTSTIDWSARPCARGLHPVNVRHCRLQPLASRFPHWHSALVLTPGQTDIQLYQHQDTWPDHSALASVVTRADLYTAISTPGHVTRQHSPARRIHLRLWRHDNGVYQPKTFLEKGV